MYSMIMKNRAAGSRARSRGSRGETLVSKKSIFDRIHQGVQRRRGEEARRFLENSAEDDSGNGRQNAYRQLGKACGPLLSARSRR